MTQPRRIVVASPIEPSGASWLLNCFLELGIRIDHKPVVDRVWRGSTFAPQPERMWMTKDGGSAALHPKADALRKFLPALTRHSDFVFRDDVIVHYIQDFPSRQTHEQAPVLMVRDPRDALYSSYRRAAPTMSFAEYLRFPNSATLLGRPAHWALFIAAWLSQPDVHIVRFEDYKRDAHTTLCAVLAALDFSYRSDKIEEAVRFSSFERARDAEQALLGQFPSDRQVANRSGKVGEGRDQPEVRALIPEIDRETAAVLQSLGYEMPVSASDGDFRAARLCAAFLAFFDTVDLPAAVKSVPLDMAASQDHVVSLLFFAHQADTEWLSRANLPPAELRKLIDSLREFTQNHATWLTDKLTCTRKKFEDGSSYFFQQVRAMRQSRSLGLMK